MDEKLRKKYGISSKPRSPQQIYWLVVYGPITLCNKKKIRKNYNIVPRESYIFDVGPMLLPFKNGPMERSYKFR